MSKDSFKMDGLSEFMDEITGLVEDGDRQYGVAMLGLRNVSLKE